MEKKYLKYVDHTLLKPTATWDQIKVLCQECIEYKMASVCIPPSYVERSKQEFGKALTVCTVIGFPLGYSTCESKISEAADVISKGADEIDMVINLGDVKDGNYEKILTEISEIKKVCENRILKVIIETCYLTTDEKIKLCECVSKSGADFIKTSTGFGSAGASSEDVVLFNHYLENSIQIKAAGGIKTLEEFKDFIDKGCSRIGTSSALRLT